VIIFVNINLVCVIISFQDRVFGNHKKRRIEMTTIETTTKAGVKVELIFDGDSCKVVAHHPTLGDLKGFGAWEETPKGSGVVIYTKVKDHYQNVILGVPREDWLKMEAMIEQAKADKKQARLDIEAAQPKYRMLITSGHYYMDSSIASVCAVPDQSDYADWIRGRVVMGLIDSKPIDIKRNDSPTAFKIIETRKSSGLMYGSGESSMWEITPEEEAQILSECISAETARNNKDQDIEKAEIDRVAEIVETAIATGTRQVVSSWITEDCMNGGHECSFDQATRWAMPDGTTKITYTCCH